MIDDHNIPTLTDLIEEKIESTQPEPGFNASQDLVFDTDDDPYINFDSISDDPPQTQSLTNSIAAESELEQTVKRILDEHMALAWQEIRLAIQVARNDKD